MSSPSRPAWRRAAVLALVPLAGVASCRAVPTGPSLSAVAVNGVALRATTGNTALCCCRVTATVVNNNEVPVHATLKFWAFDNLGANPDKKDAISAIFEFVPDLEPRTSRAIDSAGFIYPCSVIRQLTTEVEVKGVAYPPL